MKVSVVVASLLAIGPALAQQTQTEQEEKEKVVVTADQRQEAFEKQVTAEREAAEARRLFGELREGRGDRALACRTAAQAARDYAEAIQEARQLARDAEPQLKQRLEERISAMTDRRGNLEDVEDRLCEGAGMTRGPIDRGAGGQGARRRPQ
jgi:hypothetical protein